MSMEEEVHKAIDDTMGRYGNTLDLLAAEDGGKPQTVDFGEVPVFEGAKADKEQALKVVEEAAELFGAYQAWARVMDMDAKTELYDAMVAEAADVVQALANFLAGLGINDMKEDMQDCKELNERRGRVYAENPKPKPIPKPCPFCGRLPNVDCNNETMGSVVSCGNDECGVRCYTFAENVWDAIEAWNRRAE